MLCYSIVSLPLSLHIYIYIYTYTYIHIYIYIYIYIAGSGETRYVRYVRLRYVTSHCTALDWPVLPHVEHGMR